MSAPDRQDVTFRGVQVTVPTDWVLNNTIECSAPTVNKVVVIRDKPVMTPHPSCLTVPMKPEIVFFTTIKAAESYNIVTTAADRDDTVGSQHVRTGMIDHGYIIVFPRLDVVITIQSMNQRLADEIRGSVSIK